MRHTIVKYVTDTRGISLGLVDNVSPDCMIYTISLFKMPSSADALLSPASSTITGRRTARLCAKKLCQYSLLATKIWRHLTKSRQALVTIITAWWPNDNNNNAKQTHGYVISALQRGSCVLWCTRWWTVVYVVLSSTSGSMAGAQTPAGATPRCPPGGAHPDVASDRCGPERIWLPGRLRTLHSTRVADRPQLDAGTAERARESDRAQ